MDRQQTLDELRGVGYSMLEPLSFSQLCEVNEYLLSKPVYIDAHVPQTERNRGTDRRFPRRSVDATRSECLCVHTDDAITVPHLMERALALTDVAAQYLLIDTPVAYSANAFWTRAGSADERPDIQAFHKDLDDTRFLAMFVFLTNVDANTGGQQDLVGPDGVTRTISGPAGTVFLADTSRDHRGRKPLRGERGLYWWRWGVSDRPPAGVWDKIEPVPASALPGRYPEDPRLRRSIELLVSPPPVETTILGGG